MPAMSSDPSDPDLTRIRIMEAIARTVQLTARYNGLTLTLAPHALFARRGDLFVSALNLAKTWRAEEEPRLGYFKLSGLADVALTEEPFETLPRSAAWLARPEDELILAVAG